MKKALTLLSSALIAIGAWAQNYENGHEYVDLGLYSGTLWATCNVGADSPEKSGGYYAWGEIETKNDYSFSTYKFMDHDKDSKDGYTKYTIADGNKSGVWYDAEGNFAGDDMRELSPEDDVASKIWGGAWRTPSYAQLSELQNECYWVWTDTYKGQSVNGYIVYKAKDDMDQGRTVAKGQTAKSSYDVSTDVHIFLPATDMRASTTLPNPNETSGIYQSRTLYGSSHLSNHLSINKDFISTGYDNRYFGFSVRPAFQVPLAQIIVDDNTYNYYGEQEFQYQFRLIHSQATVKLYNDVTLSEDGSLYSNHPDADITINLNGHNIKGNVSGGCVLQAKFGKLTIEGEGIVENIGANGKAFASSGDLVINGGTYKGASEVCYVSMGYAITINGGMFKGSDLCFTDNTNRFTEPIVKGGLFSMDPTDCVAVGYEVVNNDDEATKAEYPYKVVALPIAQITIGEEPTKYYDAVALINAVFASQETASVKLLADINLGNGSLTISKKDTEVVLDLNGHSLNGAVTTSNNNAHLIICDNSEEQTGSIVSSNIPVIAFASTSITINGGTFVGKTAIYLDDESSVTLNAGKFDVVEKTLDYASENATITLGEGKALKLADNTILTKITGNVEQSSEVIDAPSTPTAIESVNADKAQKCLKTIENGRVVVIRGDKKYDLSGRKL